MLAIDFDIGQPVLIQEKQVVPLLLMRLSEHRHRTQRRLLLLRHGGVKVHLHLLHGQAGIHRRGAGAVSSSEPVFILGSSLETSGELADMPYSTHMRAVGAR